jgi:hypothetical protein
MSKYSCTDAEFSNIRREEDRMQGFINHCPYQRGRGMQLAWILYWGCQEHREGVIQSLWWWIDFPKWHTSFHVKRLVTQLTLRTYFSKRSFDFMGFQGVLFRIETQSSYGIFGGPYGRSWEITWNLVRLIILRRMDRQKWGTGVWETC